MAEKKWTAEDWVFAAMCVLLPVAFILTMTGIGLSQNTEKVEKVDGNCFFIKVDDNHIFSKDVTTTGVYCKEKR